MRVKEFFPSNIISFSFTHEWAPCMHFSHSQAQPGLCDYLDSNSTHSPAADGRRNAHSFNSISRLQERNVQWPISLFNFSWGCVLCARCTQSNSRMIESWSSNTRHRLSAIHSWNRQRFAFDLHLNRSIASLSLSKFWKGFSRSLHPIALCSSFDGKKKKGNRRNEIKKWKYKTRFYALWALGSVGRSSGSEMCTECIVRSRVESLLFLLPFSSFIISLLVAH